VVQIRLHQGTRDVLQQLFAEADDSESQIASYRDVGEILVAWLDGAIVGHVQIVETDEPAIYEIKSLAVAEKLRSRGIGAELVKAACAHGRRRNARSLLVATAAASIPALQFYQRQGFRIRRVIRDFYGRERGYRPLELNGIPLLDEVILDLELSPAPSARLDPAAAITTKP
jgi:ribosomal protein S18 acetylase RimI-like enzyme